MYMFSLKIIPTFSQDEIKEINPVYIHLNRSLFIPIVQLAVPFLQNCCMQFVLFIVDSYNFNHREE